LALAWFALFGNAMAKRGQHLSNTFKKSCITIGGILTMEKFNKSGVWHGLRYLEVQWPKVAKPCQLPSFYKFASSKISPIVKHDIQMVFHLTSLENQG
jgi:hypothetical protein